MQRFPEVALGMQVTQTSCFPKCLAYSEHNDAAVVNDDHYLLPAWLPLQTAAPMVVHFGNVFFSQRI